MLRISRSCTRCSLSSVIRLSPALYPGPPKEMSTFADAIEEETLPQYRAQKFYPVFLGETFHQRYKVVAKLGFGSTSTTWLARDVKRWKIQRDRFVAIKVITNEKVESQSAVSELTLSQHIAKADPKHEGLRYVRTVLESFEVKGPYGKHLCLVYVPILLKPLLKFLLTGLDYLHTSCHVIHTDIKPDNILLAIEDDGIIKDLIEDEKKNPTPRKVYDDRHIYPHRNFGDLKRAPGRPKIADFGLAVEGSKGLYNHPIQPDLLQAPEVILRAGWSYSADIWNLGVMIWDLMEGHSLFNAEAPESDDYAAAAHLGEMISLLGPPPKPLVLRGESSSLFFIPDGNPIHREVTESHGTGLEGTITTLHGEDKRLFLRFVARMLKWSPGDRATAAELLADPWLHS